MNAAGNGEMSEQPTGPDHEGAELERRRQPGDPVADPGLPEHAPRLTDVDEGAAKRVERQVAGMFALASLLVIGFIVAYVAIPIGDGAGGVDLAALENSNLALGLTLGLAMFLLGAGAIHWARKLMTSHEIVHTRHNLRGADDVRQTALADFEEGTDESGFGRRKLIRNSLLGAMALLPLPAVVLLRDLGPRPRGEKETTLWTEGIRVVNDVTFEPVRASDVDIGSLVNAMPANFEELPEHGSERLNQRAKSPIILVRIQPEAIHVPQGRENWHADGILAYSTICTHVGCPVSLYESDTHHMMCPCHQSTFDLSDAGKVVFGPAARSLPQLPIAVDDEGYLVAQSDFTEPVGPTYREL